MNHEKNMASSLLAQMEQIRTEEKAQKILEVTITLGALAGIGRDRLLGLLRTMSVGTRAEGCEIIIEQEPIKVYCHYCSTYSMARSPMVYCGKCASADVQVVSGDKMEIEEVSLL